MPGFWLVPPLDGYATQVLADSPRGYWRLNETGGSTAIDSSGNGLNGTYVGTPTLGTTGATTGTAMTLAGDSPAASYVQVPHNSLLAITGDITMEAWVNLTASSNYWWILFKGITGNPSSYSWRFDNTETRATAYIGDGSTQMPLRAAGDGSANVTLSTWAHVAMTITAAGASTAYLNGVAVGTDANALTRTDDGGPLFIGTRNGDFLTGFNGSLDEVAVYASVLSPSRIASHYAAR